METVLRTVTRVGWHVLTLAAAVLSLALYGREQRQRGRAEAENARMQSVIDSLAQRTAVVDTIYRRDTVRLWRTVARYDSVRVVDTLVRNDTVFVPRIVADAAIYACRATVLTCEERVRLRDAQLVAWQRRWDTRAKPSNPVVVWAWRVAFFELGRQVGR